MNGILQTIDISTLTLGRVLAVLGSAVGLTLVIILTYLITHRKTGHRNSLLTSMMIIGPVACVIIMLVGNSLAKALTVGGGLAMVRYRNTLDDPRDLAYLLLSLTMGMACGVGSIGAAAVATCVICAVLLIAHFSGFANFGGSVMKLRILIPESMNFAGVFDEDLKKYCRSWNLDRVRTEDYGTLIELQYRVRLRDIKQEKELMDALRTKNGNLNVQIVQSLVAD